MMPTGYEKRGELWVRRDDVALLQAHGLCDFEQLLLFRGGKLLSKKGLANWRERIELSVGAPGHKRQLFLKRYTRPPWTEQCKRLLRFRSSTARMEWDWLNELERCGLKVPVPAAFGERTTGLWESASLILTHPVAGDTLGSWLSQRLERDDLDHHQQKNLCRQLALLVRCLHESGYVHRDLYSAHVFVAQQDDGEFKLSLIDLQRVLRPRWRRRRWQIKDLAALNYSMPDQVSTGMRLRWLRYYQGENRPRDRALAYAVARKTQKIARHSRKHGLG